MNTNYVYPSAQVGEFRQALLYASGPASYAAAGDPVYNPGTNEYINFPSSALTQSGSYEVKFFPSATGNNIVRAGAPTPGQSGWTALWTYSGKQGVTGASQNAAGSGMTVGNVGTIAFSGGGGSGATGTFTVLTATTGVIAITNPGSGYTSAPTGTVTGTGGTAPTLNSITVAPSGGAVTAATNLSGETVQFQALVSSL